MKRIDSQLTEYSWDISDQKGNTTLGLLMKQEKASVTRRILASIISIAGGYFYFVVPVFRNELQDYLHINLSEYGLLLSVGFIPGALAVLGAGALITCWGARSILKWSLLAMAMAYGVAVLANHWYAMLIAVALITSFSQVANLAAFSVLTQLFPTKERRVMSAFLVTNGVIGFFSPLLAELLLKLHHGNMLSFGAILHWPFVVVALLLIYGSILLHYKAPENELIVPMESPFKNRQFILPYSSIALMALLVMHSTVDSSLMLWLPRILTSSSFSTVTILPGSVMAGFALSYVISRSLLTWLPEQTGRRLFMAVPGLLGGGIFLFGVLSRNQAITSISYVLGGFFWSWEYPTFLAVLSRQNAHNFAAAMAIMLFISSFATFGMTSLMGVWASHMREENLWKLLLVPTVGFLCVGVGGTIWQWRYWPTSQSSNVIE